jgi:hypothetical protein
MHIGVDFDNTIVCYDALFHKVAREQGLIPAEVPVNKSDVRNHLRRVGKEDAWTEMQGVVYGSRLVEASPYPGVIDFFQACRTAGIRVSIISHKTKHPFLGERHDLHAAAQGWLEQQGFFDPARIGLPRENAFFELTKQAKLERIARCGCTHFIDDLPEFLAEAGFSPGALRVLFDSNNLYAAEDKFVRVQTWAEVGSLFAADLENPPVATALRTKFSPFLQKRGVRSGFVLQPLPGGANNRVYRLRAEQRDQALKIYFQNPADPRDRFRAEQSFYEHLWSSGVRRSPEPLGWDETNRFGLFSFVDGRKLCPDEVGSAAVREALNFIVEANRTRPAQGAMPVASEACFSLAEHIGMVDRRMERLRKVQLETDIDAQAAAFVQEELRPAWEEIRSTITTHAGKRLNDLLPPAARCLSPSDFGFHNALMPADGRLRFLDFEYAGWDDPAKLCCDFFCQPQLPVSLQHWDLFTGGLAEALGAGGQLATRARQLLPAYQIKWCCIMLNEFLGDAQSRRAFALGDGLALERKHAQLGKARLALGRISQVRDCDLR